MKLNDTKNRLRKAWPYITGILIVIVGVQAWCLARAYQGTDRSTADSEQTLFEDLPDIGFQLPDTLLGPKRDSFFDDFFTSPFGDVDMWDPFQNMPSLKDRMDGIFGNRSKGLFSDLFDFGELEDPDKSSRVDIEEKEDRYIITIELPGAENSTLDVTCKDQQVTISGTIEIVEHTENDKGMVQQQRRSERFSRSIPLTLPVQADKMETTTENGIVTVMIPKEVS